jgi:Peptidase family M49
VNRKRSILVAVGVAVAVATSSLVGLSVACRGPAPSGSGGEEKMTRSVADRLSRYTTVPLTTDVASLSDWEREMIPHLIRAAQAMDRAFWRQSYGDEEELMSSLDDPDARRYAEVNFGPWDRLDENEPFLEGYEEKPKGASFYPEDMTREELEAAASSSEEKGKALRSPYTMVRRNADGALEAIPYSVFFEDSYGAAADELRQAAALAEDPQLKGYLELRARALQNDDYRPSDLAWMDMKDNVLDIVIGPIETYEDELFGYKTANEALVLVKDREWSRRLARYVALLPDLQKALPVPEEYKSETPGMDSDLNAYDVVYYAGDANAGVKAIAVNLPNDEEVQLQKGTRRLQLKNAMRAKFDKILVPLTEVLMDPGQRDQINFDAFFENVMFHEVAHGLGIKNTLDGKGTVRSALKERASAVEEAKADVLGLFMVEELAKRGELEDKEIRDNYITFFASILRSVRFGAADAHGRANLVQLAFLEEHGAFAFDAKSQFYRVDVEKMREGIRAITAAILKFQGDGDYEGLGRFNDRYQVEGPTLQANLKRLEGRNIPVDVVFDQGMDVLGREK